MFNLWLMVRDDVAPDINECLNTLPEDYIGSVTDLTREIFEKMPDFGDVQDRFRVGTIDDNTYYMYSLYYQTSEHIDLEDDIDYLVAQYPDPRILIGGAWDIEDGGIVSHGELPIHTDLIQMMPYIINQVTLELEEPTEVADVNVIAGQAPRDFTP